MLYGHWGTYFTKYIILVNILIYCDLENFALGEDFTHNKKYSI